VDLDGLAEVSLPATLERLKTAGRNRDLGGKNIAKLRLLGDHSLNPLESNFWALSHGFVFGGESAQVRLLLSRVADGQSFYTGQIYFEWATQVFLSPQNKQLDWHAKKISKSVTIYDADLEPEPNKNSRVWILIDREKLLELMIWGDPQVVKPDYVSGIFEEIRRTYRLKSSLDSYFASVRKTLSDLAGQRRQNYAELLQKLEDEELDYAPTPRVVLFNRNLACQFWWLPFDSTGIPWEFAILGRLGELSSRPGVPAWAELSQQAKTIQIFGLAPGGQAQWLPFSPLKPESTLPSSRVTQLAIATGWAAEEPKNFAYAGLEFRFDQPIPKLSEWLDDLEAATKAATRRGLITQR
jgi:hypothetical protein